jgi:hypothetical protein
MEEGTSDGREAEQKQTGKLINKSPEEALLMSPFVKNVLICVLGIAVGISSTVGVMKKKLQSAQATIANQKLTIDDLKQDASDLDDQIELKDSYIQFFKTSSDLFMKRMQNAEANPAAQMLAQTGHVMNEEQCRAWSSMGGGQPGGISTVDNSQSGTVIFEPATRQVDVHLSVGMLRGLNLTNLPSFKVGPVGPMAPHWVIPGKVMPVFVGDSHGAIYYFFEDGRWTGPLTPAGVAQQQ